MVTSPDQAPRTLRDLVGGYVGEQCSVIRNAPEQLRARGPVVHPTRVAVRRLRSTIRVFDDLFDVPLAAELEDELVWWAATLGVVRDLDILERRLEAAVGELPDELVIGPVASALEREIGARRRSGWLDIDAALDSDRFDALLRAVQRWQNDPPFAAAADRPATSVQHYVKRANKKVTKRLAASARAYAAGDAAAPELAHAARKAAKRHRYAVELSEPVWGAKANKIVERRKALQDVLGGHQDAVVCAAFLRDAGVQIGARRGHNGFTYGILFAQEQAELARLPERLAPFLH
jgi:CHAD domain-containing protein